MDGLFGNAPAAPETRVRAGKMASRTRYMGTTNLHRPKSLREPRIPGKRGNIQEKKMASSDGEIQPEVKP